MFFINYSLGGLLAIGNFLRQLVSQSVRLIMSAGVLLLIVACQPHLPIISAGSAIPASDSISDSASGAESEIVPPATESILQLSPELLYDILVATIAAQRNHHELALKSLSRAAYRSKDSRLIIEAIRFALVTGAYQHASELGQFFNRLEPNNQTATLLLARARFELGDDQDALQLLTELVSNQTDDVLVLQEAATLLAKQERPTVLHEFAKYLDNTPANAPLILTAALLASKLGNADEYIRLLDDTLELKPDWEVVGMFKLNALSGGDIDSLNRFATAHLSRHPKQSRFRLEYAQLLIQQNEVDDALNHLNQILRINPNSADALFLAGILHLNRNSLKEAKKMLLRQLESSTYRQGTHKRGTNEQGTNDQSRLYLADIEIKLKNYPAAALYLHGVSSPRYYLQAQIKMGQVIAERDNVEAALRHFRQIHVANDNQKIQIILAQDALLKARNRLAQSKLVLNEGLEQYPKQPDLLYSRGLLAAQMNLLALHERDMRKIIALQPENAHAYNALGYTLANQTDRLDEALTLIRKADQLLPNNSFILDSMGWVHFKLGNIAQALTFLRHAFRLNHDAEIAAHLGEVLWVSDSQEEAMKIWAQATQRQPENVVLKNTIERFSQPQPSND